ncbi:hypothetical protein PVAP13_6NG270464 [Panicum virgatum]|uniref:Uncharacterized protein n=1 Tax=Panicum virgatum TaxID=38727 RepID=A0A8T0R331_PANVG|nr:hypothetical protein PVAP13_6NG270464 [Panicum virgatum]
MDPVPAGGVPAVPGGVPGASARGASPRDAASAGGAAGGGVRGPRGQDARCLQRGARRGGPGAPVGAPRLHRGVRASRAGRGGDPRRLAAPRAEGPRGPLRAPHRRRGAGGVASFLACHRNRSFGRARASPSRAAAHRGRPGRATLERGLGLHAPAYAMGCLLHLTAWALVAAVPFPDRSGALQANHLPAAPPRAVFRWAPPLLALPPATPVRQDLSSLVPGTIPGTGTFPERGTTFMKNFYTKLFPERSRSHSGTRNVATFHVPGFYGQDMFPASMGKICEEREGQKEGDEREGEDSNDFEKLPS